MYEKFRNIMVSRKGVDSHMEKISMLYRQINIIKL